jgi:hypothetical protein
MEIDPAILHILIRRRRLMARKKMELTAILEITPLLFDDDDVSERIETVHGGSKPGKRPNRPRDFEGSYQRLHNQYFSANPLYDDEIFRRRFRMARPLFLKIVEAVEQHDNYFQQRPDACGKMGLRPILKITAALRMLAYGGAADCNDEYLQLSETTSLQSMDRFCNAIVAIYSSEYLRHPTVSDLERLLTIGAKRGFPGMLGSLDCMHWTWKNCPAGWAGQFQGKEKVSSSFVALFNTCVLIFLYSMQVPTVILEAVASNDLWIWHAWITQRHQCIGLLTALQESTQWRGPKM